MAANRNGLVLIDPSGTGGPYNTGRWPFVLAPTGQGSRGYTLSSEAFEPGRAGTPFRIPLHPWTGGLWSDRLRRRNVYAKSNIDASYEGFLAPPPLLTTLTFTNATISVDKAVEFNGSLFVNGGRYMYAVNLTTYAVTEDKDFGVGKAAVDMAVFNNELVVAMGETEKIYTRNTSGTWTQATDNTFAIALGVVDNLLWRAETTNQLSNCTSSPRTLTSWAPAGTGAYKVGDTTHAVHSIIDYGGSTWAIKADGAYQADPAYRFHNQTPQARRQPASDNGKGAFVAQGQLWIPTQAGLIRILPGQSLMRGPEITARPDMRFRVRGGAEWGDAIYLLVTDEGAVENTFVCKMQRSDDAPKGYIFHELVRAGATTTGRFIAASGTPTNPSIFFGLGANGRYFKLGRGGGRDVDDANYAYGAAWEIESGAMLPASDLGITSTVQGVQVVLKQGANETTTIAAAYDGQAFTNLLDTQDGGGVAAISGATTNFEKKTRYATVNTSGQFLSVKISGTSSGGMSGTTRWDVREAWAFGVIHPEQQDVIELGLYLSPQARPLGQRVGLSREQMEQQMRKWKDAGTTLQMELENYVTASTVRVVVRDWRTQEQVAVAGDGGKPEKHDLMMVSLARVDLAGSYAT